MATDGNSDPRGRHPEFEPPDPPRSAAFLSGNYNLGCFVSKMAQLIETEFGIRALQAALVERRNKDRVGHIFCHLRLIIVPGGGHKGRGGTRASRLPAPALGLLGRGGLRLDAVEGGTGLGESSLHRAGQRKDLGVGRPEELRGRLC